MDFSQGSLFEDYTKDDVTSPIRSTLSVVRELKANNEDHEWYPSTDTQINIIIDDIKRISVHYDLTARHSDKVDFLDINQCHKKHTKYDLDQQSKATENSMHTN